MLTVYVEVLMRRLRFSVYAWVVAAALGGCAAGEAEYGGEVRVSSPELVTVSPSVQVIADADEPLFYADGYYWLYRDNTWLRSDSYNRGFARIDVNIVPQGVRTIRDPQGYTHYRRNGGGGHAYARGAQTQQRTQQPQVTQPARQQQQPPPPQPWQEPRREPTAPTPPAPYEKPPVPNAIPGHEGIDHDMDREHDNRPQPDTMLPNDHDNNQPDRKIDKNDKNDHPDKANQPNKSEKNDKKRDYGE
jgi:hypothetical protein